MVDQVKVTVIATGFDEAKMRLQRLVAKPQPMGEKPITVKEAIEEKEKGKEEFSPEIPPEEMGEEFEIPAFLRQGH